PLRSPVADRCGPRARRAALLRLRLRLHPRGGAAGRGKGHAVTWTITRQDLLDLAYGAALLGSGGGGDPYIGRLMAERALDRGRTVTVWDLDEVPDDGLVISTAMMGAPTVMIEKLPAGTEGVAALHALEEHLGRSAIATIPMECGGLNST